MNKDKDKNKTEVSLDVELVWGLTSEDREALCESGKEIVVTQNGINEEDRKEKFYNDMYNTIKKARLAKGDKSDPFFWVTK